MKPPDEWFKQAEYDLATAQALFKAVRYIYTLFMCHLSIEKALKALYAKKFQKDPPKIHNLNYLCEKIKLRLPENYESFVDNLNNLSVPTRYPDQIEKLVKEYKREKTRKIMHQTKELLLWLKKSL
jgi:HEPN domain-containing protein